MVTAVSVVRDFDLHRRCLRENPKCCGVQFVTIDNTSTNQPIPVRYNGFLDSYDYSRETWFMFCHEDFEPLEDVERKIDELKLDKMALYGPIGCRRRGLFGFGMQAYCGEIEECNRSGGGSIWKVGSVIETPVEVETFDCCCMLVHSSLVERFALRFDEELLFDLYVEDLCASCKVQHGISSFAIPFKACHHSGSVPTTRLRRHLPYLRQKYPHNYFTGTCTYFGTPTWQKRLQDFILSATRRSKEECRFV